MAKTRTNYIAESRLSALKNRAALAYRRLSVAIQKRPMTSFFAILAILLLSIIISKALFTPKPIPVKKAILTKTVAVYQVDTTPKLAFQGQVRKAGVVKLLAQAPGVVTSINVTEGQKVGRGAGLLNLSTNYQGANSAGVAAQIAARQYQQITDTYDTQQNLIDQQRHMADLVHDNSSNIATISGQAIGNTQSLINQNADILNQLNSGLTMLQNSNVGGTNNATILQTEEAISQLQGGQNQLQSALNNLQYSTNTSNPPQQMIDLQRDIAGKGLDLQQKGLELNRDMSKLQLTLANISASLFHPTAPIAGTIERIFVRKFDSVNPGQALLTITGTATASQLVVTIPETTAGLLSHIGTATVHFTDHQEEIIPGYISTEATDNGLYSVVFNLPVADYAKVANGDYLQVDLPLAGQSITGGYFIPLDAVTQTQDQSLVYVITQSKAEARSVTLGTVSGQFIQVVSGLTGSEKIILDRTVISGDAVQAL